MGSQLNEKFIVWVVKELDRAFSKETYLVKHLVITLDLFKGKDANQKVKHLLKVLIFKLSLVEALSSHLEHNIFQMNLSQSLNLVRILFIQFFFIRSFVLG